MKKLITLLLLLSTVLPLYSQTAQITLGNVARKVQNNSIKIQDGSIALYLRAREDVYRGAACALASGGIKLTETNVQNCSGIAEGDIASGSYGYMVIAGIVYAKVSGDVLTGYVAVSTGAQRGGITMGDGIPPVEHDYEIGHFLLSGASGTYVPIVLHFN